MDSGLTTVTLKGPAELILQQQNFYNMYYDDNYIITNL